MSIKHTPDQGDERRAIHEWLMREHKIEVLGNPEDDTVAIISVGTLRSLARAALSASQQREPQEAAEMTEEAVRLWLAQRGRMSVPRSDYLKAIAPASLREAQIQAVASAVDACEERGCKECAGMLRGEIHRLRVWAFKDSRSAPPALANK